jgi:hypothetical protein
MVYDPAADRWTKAAPYPAATAYLSCGGIDTKVYCAGGAARSDGYAYDPAANAWSAIADLPLDLMSSAYAVANGRLLVSTGFSYGLGAATNEGYAYDPSTNAWSALPNANVTVYGSVAAAGFYLVGGTDLGTGLPTAGVEQLRGYDQPYADVPWLSARAATSELSPGKGTTVTVVLDADQRTTSMLTEYSAAVTIETDTPYRPAPVPVTMQVEPPKSWGHLTGTVGGPDGRPLAGATVRLETARGRHTVTTDAAGGYDAWLSREDNPVRITVTAPGYRTATAVERIRGGETSVRDFTLKPGS